MVTPQLIPRAIYYVEWHACVWLVTGTAEKASDKSIGLDVRSSKQIWTVHL